MRQTSLSFLAVAVAACGTVNTSDPGEPDDPCTSADLPWADDDEDGAVDEGCPWALSTPHWIPSSFGTPWTGGLVDPSAVSHDGATLYVIVTDDFGEQQRPFILERRGDGFAPPRPLTGADVASYSIAGIAVSADGGAAYLSARPWPGDDGAEDDDNDLYVATITDGELGPLVALPALSDASLSDDRPALRGDDGELVFVRGRSILHAVADASGAFTSARPLVGTLVGEVSGPQLSRDGRTLFYSYTSTSGGTHSLYRAERTPGSDEVGPSVQLAGLGEVPDGFFPVLSEATRELYFASASGRSWGPNTHSLWRARVCRDGEACALPAIDCPTGTRSPDGLHCYTAIDEQLGRAEARARCLGLGGDLVSVQSSDEQQLVWARFGDRNRWLGAYDDRDGTPECNRAGLGATDPLRCAFAWDTGEAPTYEHWAPAEPSDSVADVSEDCVILWYDDPQGGLHHGAWNDVSCAFTYASVCEAVRFPIW